MLNAVWSLLVGILAGVMSGLFGIGGGIVIVPLFVFLLGYSQHKAQGTSLAALLLPVGLLGVLEYHKEQNVNLQAGLIAAIGLFLGALAGAKIAVGLDPLLMRRGFSVFLALVAAYLWFKK